MILTADIGNSIIMLGGFVGDELVFVGEISTDTKKTADEYATAILNIFSLYGVSQKQIDGCIISSVVPILNNVIKRAVNLIFGVEPIIVGPGIKTGIGIRCDTPSTVGADLICTAVATQSIYGAPALIVDVGTATKISYLNGKGEFVGVSIMPGVLMGLVALADGTAQLPKVSLDAPSNVIAKNTADCIRSGVIFGNASMIDGMIDRIKDELGEEPKVYATGGLASAILPYSKKEFKLDENLVLKGLNILYALNTSPKSHKKHN